MLFKLLKVLARDPRHDVPLRGVDVLMFRLSKRSESGLGVHCSGDGACVATFSGYGLVHGLS